MHNEYDNKQDEALHANDATQDTQAEEQRLAEQLQLCQLELAQWKDQFMRIGADFENYKRRQEKERLQTFRLAKGTILSEILPIVDNFERALAAEQTGKDSLQGFEMIYKELCKMLKKQGLEEIALGSSFDPELYEAIMTVPSDAHVSGDVVEILQKGYKLDGEVLRPAQVSIAA